ncbi:hypothetical protein ADUPG1_009450 [Aduncisulcus paluster]|uniref:Uncharacterized protein n=1 Tax=Aduncisulcus paluster TaxID=2918883 RepID=A0ABQ5KVM4_9EUKA|nr:hypothetical protein ADUPG1_009450 [Aduncisulcus paluster]
MLQGKTNLSFSYISFKTKTELLKGINICLNEMFGPRALIITLTDKDGEKTYNRYEFTQPDMPAFLTEIGKKTIEKQIKRFERKFSTTEATLHVMTDGVSASVTVYGKPVTTLVSEESEIDDPSTCFVTDRHHLSEVWSTTALPVKKRASVRRRGVSNGDLEIVRDVFEKNDDMWASDSGYAKFDKRLRSCTIVRTMRSASLEVGAMTLMTNVIEGYVLHNLRNSTGSLR